jgi:hypothetical protein
MTSKPLASLLKFTGDAMQRLMTHLSLAIDHDRLID